MALPLPSFRRITLRRVSIIASAVALTGALGALAQHPPAKAPATTQKAAAPGSLLVHVDPKTLLLSLESGAGRVPLELTPEILNKLDTSGEGLTSVTTNGVTSIDLQGRYQGVWFAVTDMDGKTRPFCLTSLPPPVAAAARALRQAQGGRP